MKRNVKKSRVCRHFEILLCWGHRVTCSYVVAVQYYNRPYVILHSAHCTADINYSGSSLMRCILCL
jgi:hypothetical protein